MTSSSGVLTTPFIESPPAEPPFTTRNFRFTISSKGDEGFNISTCKQSSFPGIWTQFSNLFLLPKKMIEARKRCFFCLCSYSDLSVGKISGQVRLSLVAWAKPCQGHIAKHICHRSEQGKMLHQRYALLAFSHHEDTAANLM